jgi:hypothetical protein
MNSMQASIGQNQQKNDELFSKMQTTIEENQKQNADMFAEMFSLIESRLPPPPNP